LEPSGAGTRRDHQCRRKRVEHRAAGSGIARDGRCKVI